MRVKDIGSTALCVGVLLCGWHDSDSALGQLQIPRTRGEESTDQISLAPRPLTRLLREGKTAINEKRYSDGIAALGALLLEEAREDVPVDVQSQDFFTEIGADGYYRNSVRNEALRLLGSIPEEGRKTLEIQYGVAARRALESAVSARDLEAIAEVTRKYYHTEAGYDASILLAQDKLIRGFPIAAAGIIERLIEFPAARKRFGAQLSGELVAALMQVGRSDLAIQALATARKYFGSATIALGQRQVALDQTQDWKVLLEQIYQTHAQAGQPALQNWTMTGGEPGRNGSVSAGLPLPSINWELPLHRDRGDEETTRAIAARESQGDRVLIPKLEARMIGDIVLTKTVASNIIYAIEMKTGRRQWPVFRFGAPFDFASRTTSIAPELQEMQANADLRNRIWGSSAFGQFSCDANQLYFINANDEPATLGPFSPVSRVPSHNMLTAASIQGEGKFIWQIGGANGVDEPALAGAYFLGPPLSFEGELYSLVEINGESRLVVLDARTGKLLWRQQLSQSHLATIGRDRSRQAQALTPAVSDAVIVCPIGNGTLIAVDLLTRSLLWGRQYPVVGADRQQQLQVFNNFGENNDQFDEMQERWHEPQILISRGQVVFTPPEGNMIACIDLLTGALRWPPQNRGSYRYVAGIHDDRIVLVGNNEVVAMNLTDGRPSWPADVPLTARVPSKSDGARAKDNHGSRATAIRERETVAGKSVRDGRFLYVPTSARRVLKIDIVEGRMVEAATVERPLGNLFAFQDRLFSVGPISIDCYFVREPLAQRVQQLLAADEKNTWALNQQALIHLADRNTKDAIALLRRSYAINPEDGETRYLLVSALLAGLEEDFDGYLSLATEFESIVESQRFEFMVLLSKGNLRSGQFEIAFKRLIDMMQERISETQPNVQSQAEMMQIAPGHQVDVDAWIATQLAAAFKLARPDEQTRMLQIVQDRLAALRNQHPIARESELRFLCWLEAAQLPLLAMAESMLGQSEQTMGERLIQPVLFSNDPELRKRAWAAMGRKLRADELDLSIYDNSNSIIITNDARNPIAENTRPLASIQWPNGLVEAAVDKKGAVRNGPMRIRQTGNRYGRPAVDVGLSSNSLTILNEFGHIISDCSFERSGDDNFLRCQVDGGLVILESQTELLAFDMYRREYAQDSPLWRFSLSRVPNGPRSPFNLPSSNSPKLPLGVQVPTRGTGSREAFVGPITPVGVVIQKDADVIMLSAQNGNRLWSRSGYDDNTIMVRNDLEIAIVHASIGKIDILDCRDGSLIRQVDYQGDWNSWFASGQNVIQLTQRESKVSTSPIQTLGAAIRILNAFTGKVIAEQEFTPAARADSTDDRYVVILEPTGKLWYCDVQSGEVVENPIPVQLKMDRPRLQRFGDRLVVLTTIQTNNAGVIVLPKADEGNLTRGLLPVSGNIFGLSTSDGRLIWERPATLYDFRFPSAQPRRSPYMACYRVLKIGTSNIAQPSYIGQIALVDLRDGTLAYLNKELSLTSDSEFGMELDPSRLGVRLSLGNFLMSLTMTDQPRPPQPVCYFGSLVAPPVKRKVPAIFDSLEIK